MERTCKNCGENIYVGKNYCSNCGAKWIEKRITLSHVASDFTDMYLGLDTRIGRTVVHLFTQPASVIKGYINGRRMGYVDPMRYVLISLIFSGLYIFILRTFEIEIFNLNTDDSIYKLLGYTPEMIERSQNINQKTGDWMSKYQSIVVFCTIPVMALIARCTFWGKRYLNFTEQIVVQMYTYAQVIICTTPITIILSLTSIKATIYWSFLSYPFMMVYNAYCYKRIFKLSFQEILLKSLMFFIWTGLILLAITIVFILLGIVMAIFFKEEAKQFAF